MNNNLNNHIIIYIFYKDNNLFIYLRARSPSWYKYNILIRIYTAIEGIRYVKHFQKPVFTTEMLSKKSSIK